MNTYVRYKITIEYDGRFFFGWQFQKGLDSVQGILESACSRFCGLNVRFNGSSRTDAGVHALNQVAHVDLPMMEEYSIMCGINFHLREIFKEKVKYMNRAFFESSSQCVINVNQSEVFSSRSSMHYFLHVLSDDLCPVSIINVEKVADDFHARFDAIRREYLYKILNRSAMSSFCRGREWHVNQSLNIDLMQQAADIFVGTHDFANFRSAQCQSKSTIKMVESCFVTKESLDMIYVHIASKSFLHNQVRIMTWFIKEVGLKKINISDIKDILHGRKMKRNIAPAFGLYLTNVVY
ncbi:tRNA pseudouridine synthase A [Candidatus Gromoviella agglomerans]|uniref:tRNA pseudouridine synthase A n=1 Tax=Candidatus Gromoviella agglomerans TaxID=2806609 RepID=UPI001E5EE2F7|nr:tRNA pseudouridine synthase A [Candidatus Gromoviella agglomerans]